MAQTFIENSKYTFPVALTATAFWLSSVSPAIQVTPRNYRYDQVSAKASWEETSYLFDQAEYAMLSKLEVIHAFANALIEESVDLAPEFSRVLDENFWELV